MLPYSHTSFARMVLLRYLVSFLPAIGSFLAFETIFAVPRALPFALGSWFVLLVVCHAFLGRREARSWRHWQFAIPPVFLFLSAATAVLLLETAVVRTLIALVVSLLVGAVSWNVYLYLYQPIRYVPSSLEHQSALCDLLAVCFGSMAVFGFRLYLGLPAWGLASAVFVWSVVLVQQAFWVAKIPSRAAAPFAVAIPLLLTELAVALAALPVTYVVAGATLAAACYAFLGMTRRVLRNAYRPAVGRRYAVIGLGSVIALLATARWS